MSEANLEIKNVFKGFGDAWNREEIISDFSLSVNPGELTVMVGPSGCGKSTLVNLIAGFDHPDSGDILINGDKVKEPGNDRMVVFQETALTSSLIRLTIFWVFRDGCSQLNQIGQAFDFRRSCASS